MASRLSLLLLLLLYISATFTSSTTNDTTGTATATSTTVDDTDDEDLSFLEEPKPPRDYPDYADPENYRDEDYEEYRKWEDSHSPPQAKVDEKDVVVLSAANFSEVLAKEKYVMVEFYAPWCGYCQALAPEYATAATEMKEEVVMAKVDAIEESDLADQFKVEGFPTVFFFADGEHTLYNGDQSKDAIVTWLKKKTGSAVHNVTTADEALKILSSEPKLVVAFLDSLTGSDSEEFAAAARLEDDVNFYQTENADVAKIFEIDPKANRPSMVVLKKEIEKLCNFDGKFTKSAIAEFVTANKLPLVINFTRESASIVFENPIKKQMLLFAASNDSEKLFPVFQEVAKSLKGQAIFVFVEMDNEDYGKPITDYFGITGDSPRVLAYTGNEDGRKFLMDGDMATDKIKSFGEDFLADTLQPFYKSDPIPATNDDDVKIVVGKNFDEIVLDESKDVLLEIHAPWCPHCQSLEPTYNKLARHLRGVNSIVVAKMDGTRNEHPRAKSDGYPTILFFPAGKKSFDPITVDTDRTVVAFYKFLKKHATTPFKIQHPVLPPEPEHIDATTTVETPASHDNLKDEL